MLKQFATLCDAEEFYKIDYFISTNNQNLSSPSIPSTPPGQEQPNVISDSCTGKRKAKTGTVTLGDIVKNFIDAFKNKMTWCLKKQVLNCLFQDYVTDHGGVNFFSFVKHHFYRCKLMCNEDIV